MTECHFAGNTADFGGGAYLRYDCSVSDSTFTANVAHSGGGIYEAWADSGTTISRCTFTSNAAAVYHGGALCIEDGHPRIEHCTFTRNTAAEGGGAVFNFNPLWFSWPTYRACVFESNVAKYGGAVNTAAVVSVGWLAPEFVNCSFVDNWGLVSGGALMNFGAHPTVTNCTFTANVGYNGGWFDGVGGIINWASDATVVNSILWGNLGGEIVNLDGGACEVSYSDVQGDYAGAGNMNVDPAFVSPATGDCHLAPGSPAIDAGDSTAVPLDVTSDLDGEPRFVDDPDTPDTGIGHPCVDLGAYELQRACPEDINDDGIAGFADVLAILVAWGESGGPADVDRDGVVGRSDLLRVVTAWGPCPPTRRVVTR